MQAKAATTSPGETPNRQASRVRRSRAKVLEAAVAVLADRGTASFSVDAVVERSGVAKTTIYRHWPNRSELLAAAIADLGGVSRIPNTGSLRGDLLAFFRKGIDAVDGAHPDLRMRSLPGIIEAANRDPDLAAAGATVVAATVASLKPILERGLVRGEVRPDCDLEAMAHVLLGALFVHGALRYPTTGDYVRQVVDTVLDGIRGGRAAPT